MVRLRGLSPIALGISAERRGLRRHVTDLWGSHVTDLWAVGHGFVGHGHEVRVPAFLPDLPDVRKEMAGYCTSARRMDDMVGAIVGELATANMLDDTIVIFLSDHGMSVPFAPRSAVALGLAPYVIAIGSPTAWEVTFHTSDGQLQRIVRASIPRTVVTRAMVEAGLPDLPETARGLGLPVGRVEAMFRQLPIPDSLPAIRDLNWDQNGNLWVGRRTEEGSVVTMYDVFDQQGLWLSSVRAPAAIDRVHEVGQDYILATWTDDLDVPYVRMYRIRKPAA